MADTDRADPLSERLCPNLISEALKSLCPEHRAAVVRAYFLGQTLAHIAEREHISETTAKARLHHGLRALQIGLREKGVVR